MTVQEIESVDELQKKIVNLTTALTCCAEALELAEEKYKKDDVSCSNYFHGAARLARLTLEVSNQPSIKKEN
jgi:hypothetical protein